MKKLLYGLGLAAVLLAPACTSELEDRMDKLEERVSSLETQVKNLNSQVSLVNQLLSGKYFVQSVADLADGTGYKLVLVDADGKTVEKQVLNGQNGSTPSMGLKKDTDGNYYWTVDGQWLLVGGQKVRANGIDGEDGKDGQNGLTPEFKVEQDGYWYVRLGSGNWEKVGQAYTEITGPIQSVDATSREDVVIIYLTDGGTIEVPKAAAAVKLQVLFDESVFETVSQGGSVTVDYTVLSPQGITYTLDSYEPEGWVVAISEPKNDKGTITVTLPSDATSGKILFVLNGSDGTSFTKVVRVGVSQNTVYNVDETAGSIQLPSGATNVKVNVSWITVSGSELIIEANTTPDARTAVVTYTDANGETRTITIVQAQQDAIVLTETEVSASPKGETILYYVKTNVPVEVSADVDWIEVASATKGLQEIPYSFTVAANTGTVSRTGKVTFTAGDLSETVTVNQAPMATGGTGEFILVTDASELAEGDEILITNLTGTYAMAEQYSGNTPYRKRVEVQAVNDAISEVPDNAAIITLEGSAGSWNFAVEDGYLASRATGNALTTVSSVTANATWSITISGEQATVTAGAGNSRQICYNSSASRFSCYSAPSNTATVVSIYRRSSVPATPVTEYQEIGCYIGGKQYIYEAGTDQYVRSYSGNALTFVLLNPDANEQAQLSGYTSALSTGSDVTMQLFWRQGAATVVSKSYSMTVLKEEGQKVWIGDTRGNGFIIKK